MIKNTELNGVYTFFEQYYEGRINNIEMLKGVSTNQCWLIDSGSDRFVLRKCLKESLDWIYGQEKIIATLVENHFPVQPLLSFNNNLKSIVTDNHYWQLRPFIPGRTFTKGLINDEIAAAKALRVFHDLQYPIESLLPNILKGAEYWFYEQEEKLNRLEYALSKIVKRKDSRELMEIYKKLLYKSLVSFSVDDYYRLPMTLTHGDFHANNLIFGKDELLAVIDMDSLGFRPRIYDIAISIYLLMRKQSGSFELVHDRAIRFMRTYINKDEFLGIELQAIAPLLRLHFLPTAEYLEMIALRGEELVDWFITWSLKAAVAVSEQIEILIKRYEWSVCK